MKNNFLTKEQKISYKNYGAIVIKNVFEPWISTLRKGFDKVLANPGPHARENVKTKEQGRFFEDYCNWQRIPEFKKCAEESPAAQIVAEATGSKSIQLFHEHIFVKNYLLILGQAVSKSYQCHFHLHNNMAYLDAKEFLWLFRDL